MRKPEDIIRRRNAKAVQKLRSFVVRTLASLEKRDFPGAILRSVPGAAEQRATWRFQPIGYDWLWKQSRYLDAAGNLYEYSSHNPKGMQLMTDETLMRLGANYTSKWIDRVKQLT